jgi:hypothetical protein
MRNELNADDPQSLWQSQQPEEATITLEEIRKRAARFERRIRWRNFREYAAGAVVIVFFPIACRLRHLRGWRLAPAGLLIAGTIYVMFQLHRRAATRTVPADADTKALIEFHRRELERQRDALRSVWRWYLFPFVPGFAASAVEAGIDRGITVGFAVGALAIVLILAGIWALNQHAARRLECKIREWKSMEGSND